ncbi:O-methyltransferase [Sphaerisporangium corydalis]|uniref:O-methyltransferase n=1 Tax=Sphaerisporangium corydalis TaxID=1441875 RepID=A0ABV9ENN6_9ACTN|nr:class I SAM-dependent methyltransferase [Sphaerisporangium corydalis]
MPPSISAESIDIVHPAISEYVLAHCTPADDLLIELAAETRAALGDTARMQVSHDEGALLTMLVRLTGARRAIEVGVFTGYSSICIARGLPEDGYLLACDVSTEWTSIAERYWERAGVAGRIDLRIAPAAETLRALPAGEDYDFAFIDADKAGYPVYYEEVLARLRPGGLIALDNVFLGARVLDPAFQEEHHLTMRALNDKLVHDTRVESVMLSIRDGLTLVRKR